MLRQTHVKTTRKIIKLLIIIFYILTVGFRIKSNYFYACGQTLLCRYSGSLIMYHVTFFDEKRGQSPTIQEEKKNKPTHYEKKDNILKTNGIKRLTRTKTQKRKDSRPLYPATLGRTRHNTARDQARPCYVLHQGLPIKRLEDPRIPPLKAWSCSTKSTP